MDHIRGTEEWSQIAENIREQESKQGYRFNPEEKANFISQMLQGYGEYQIRVTRPTGLKPRKIDIIDPEMNQFYKESPQALLEYVNALSEYNNLLHSTF